MEDMTVVFFYMLDAPCSVHTARWQLGEGSLTAVCAILPLRPPQRVKRGKRKGEAEWTGAGLQRYLQELQVPPEGRYVYYVPDKKTEGLLRRGWEPLGLEWIKFLIEYYALSFDGLVLVQDREMQTEELLRSFAGDVPYLAVTEAAERGLGPDWEEVQEELAEEYGLTLDVQQDFRRLCIMGKRTLMILGADTEETVTGQGPKKDAMQSAEKIQKQCMLPAGSVVISATGRRKQGVAEYFSEKNIRYVDMEGFLRDTVLDTVHKIRYNSTR